MTTEETKKCPMCAEVIMAAAVKCKHCGERLDAVAPPVPVPAPPPAPTVGAAPPSPSVPRAAPVSIPAPSKPRKWVSGAEWWYFAPVPLFLIAGCPGLAAGVAAGAIALKATRHATSKQQKVVVSGVLYAVAAILPIGVVATNLSGDLFKQSVEVVAEPRGERRVQEPAYKEPDKAATQPADERPAAAKEESACERLLRDRAQNCTARCAEMHSDSNRKKHECNMECFAQQDEGRKSCLF